MVAADDLALYYRKVNSSEIQVFRGPNAAETARSRWRKVNMYKVGEEDTSKKIVGKRDIDEIRREFYSIIRKVGYDSRYYSTIAAHHSQVHFRRQVVKGTYDYYNLKLNVSSAGPYKVNVIYSGSRNFKSSEEEAVGQFVRVIDKKAKIFKASQDIAKEMAKWLSENSKHFGEVYASI